MYVDEVLGGWSQNLLHFGFSRIVQPLYVQLQVQNRSRYEGFTLRHLLSRGNGWALRAFESSVFENSLRFHEYFCVLESTLPSRKSS